jgi:hypothetical protein
MAAPGNFTGVDDFSGSYVLPDQTSWEIVEDITPAAIAIASLVSDTLMLQILPSE